MKIKQKILVVDDKPSTLESVTGVLEDIGFEVETALDGETALKKLDESLPEAVLLDIWLPGIDGLEVLKKIKQDWPVLPVIIMSGHATIETAVKATKLGAYDVIEKPISYEQLELTIRNALKYRDLQEENILLRQKATGRVELTGESPAMKQLKEQIAIVAPTDAWVLIQGENGTGKELVAQTIHRLSKRSNKPMVEVNCAAIPEELIESELFGHEKGAFTGATSMKRGKFDLANGGTLFLDEIGDMSLKTQAKILRILQEQKFQRVGGSRTISVDVRIIAATNKDLEKEIEKGNFREDLYYRLNVIPIYVPPLRERVEDIPLLFEEFMKEFGAKTRGIKRVQPEVFEALSHYNWPGNVRELRNLVERLVILARGEEITVRDLPPNLRNSAQNVSTELSQEIKETATISLYSFPKDYKKAKQLFEKRYLEYQLKQYKGNVTKTAEAIGIERRHLHRKIKSLGIKI